MTTAVTSQINKGGLEGVVAASTALSKVEGQNGRLIYRGYDLHDLASSISFEEVAHLLWVGHLPNQGELAGLKRQLAARREIPVAVMLVLRALPPSTAPMDALRTAVSAWGAVVGLPGLPDLTQVIELVALVPVVLAAYHRLRQGLEPLPAQDELGYAANFLYLLSGRLPGEAQVRGLDAYLVMLADHGMNASTFAARVVASTQSDLVSAIVAGIGALKGPLHGGAPARVLDMLVEIKAAGGEPEVEQWIRRALARGERLMGFGHRIYKTTDPRAEELRRMAQLAAPAQFGLARQIEQTALAVLEETKPGRKLYTNVEYYSAVLLASLGLPGDMFTPTFAVSRVAGWTAHVLEQVGDNRLIRPEAHYTGPLAATYRPLALR